LWLDLVDRRSAQPSRLAEATTQIDMTKWSASVIWHYLGQMTSEAEQALQHGVNVPTCGR